MIKEKGADFLEGHSRQHSEPEIRNEGEMGRWLNFRNDTVQKLSPTWCMQIDYLVQQRINCRLWV